MSRGVKFHLGLLFGDEIFMKNSICRFWHLLINFALQELAKTFPYMSKTHMSKPGAIIIWICRSHCISCNRTTLQVVKIIASDTLLNNRRASSHLENTIFNWYLKIQCFQGTNRDKFYLTSFNYRTIPLNILIWTVHFSSMLYGRSSPITTKHPSGISKLENQLMLGHTKSTPRGGWIGVRLI